MTTKHETPFRTAKPLQQVDLTNHLFAHLGCNAEGGVLPVFLTVEPSSVCLSCFSTVEKLRKLMDQLGIKYKGIKRIDHGVEFLNEIPFKFDGKALKIIVDPWILPNGKVRYVELYRD